MLTRRYFGDTADEDVFGGDDTTAPITDDDEDVFIVPPALCKRELLSCDNGTDDDDEDGFTVFTLVSDRARSFLTASGECAPLAITKHL